MSIYSPRLPPAKVTILRALDNDYSIWHKCSKKKQNQAVTGKKISTICSAEADAACPSIKRFFMDFSSVWNRLAGDDQSPSTVSFGQRGIFCTMTSRCMNATHRQLFRRSQSACLIFLSTRVNIWHKEAVDPVKMTPVRHRTGRGGLEKRPFMNPNKPATQVSNDQSCHLTRTNPRKHSHTVCLRYSSHALKCVECQSLPNNISQFIVYC